MCSQRLSAHTTPRTGFCKLFQRVNYPTVSRSSGASHQARLYGERKPFKAKRAATPLVHGTVKHKAQTRAHRVVTKLTVKDQVRSEPRVFYVHHAVVWKEQQGEGGEEGGEEG